MYMTKRMTTAEARQHWAKVLRSAERGTPLEVTRNARDLVGPDPWKDVRDRSRGRPVELG